MLGLAPTMLKMLQEATSAWIASVKQHSQQPVIGGAAGEHTACVKLSASSEEKKDDDEVFSVSMVDNEGVVAHAPETKHLQRVLSLHLSVGKSDPTLAEEMAREGSHLTLLRLASFDLCVLGDTFTEEDEDAVVVLQDLACEIGSLGGGAFPIKYSPFSIGELSSRLPLHFTIKPLDVEKEEKENCSDQSILINQVTKRQSAQEDVGFVMWPSAVILSAWVVSNPHLLSGKTVLELGAGCGLVGLVAAGVKKADVENGRRTTECAASEVLLTDFNRVVLRNLEQNIRLNSLAEFARTEMLDFYAQRGSDDAGGWLDGSGEKREPVDLVLAADVICKPEDAVAAANTIFDCLKPGGDAYTVSADAMHRFGVERFESECSRLGMNVYATDVEELCDGQLLNRRSLEQTSGFVDGMTLTMFHITKQI